MKTYFHTQPGLVVVYGCIQENVVHRHNAIQLVWPESAASLTVDGTPCEAVAVIASRIPHQLTMDQGWILLIEPHSALGHALTARLAGRPYMALDEAPFYQGSLSTLDATLDYLEPAFDVLSKLLAPLLSALGVQRLFEQLLLQHLSMVDVTDLERAGIEMTGREGAVSQVVLSETSQRYTVFDSARLDKRVQAALVYLQQFFLSSASEVFEDKLLVDSVAKSVGLSKSRFLHVFREQMGITWRSYVLWRRLLLAIGQIRRGSNATQAAHNAGFADSAHLSRTFKTTFGLTIRDANQQWGARKH